MTESPRLPTGTVTFCITDIEGSTGLLRTLGSDYSSMLGRLRELLGSRFREGGGTVVSVAGGDSMFVAFHDAAAAVSSCLAAQLALQEERWGEVTRVSVRMGLHTGEAEPIGDDYAALAVHQAARVSAAAHGGQVLASNTTAAASRAHLSNDTSLESVGRYRLRDFDAPERLWEVRHPSLERTPARPVAVPALEPNIPRGRGEFIGREQEVESVAALLCPGVVVSLVGAGGVGKTRLAVEVARRVEVRFTDLRRFVDLTTVPDDDGVQAAVVEGLLGDRSPGGDADPLADAASNATGRSMLLIDNCEHVLRGVSQVVGTLLERCPGLAVLVTSRSRLHMAEELVVRVAPLGLPPSGSVSPAALADIESVRLFVDRARRARAGFEVTDSEVRVIASIVRRLDGIPLAIELAAALTAHHDPTTIEAELRQDPRLAELSVAEEDPAATQRTLEAVVDWSYRLLDPVTQRVFRRTAVFAGAFDEAAATSVVEDMADAAPDVGARLRALLERSLLNVEARTGGGICYRLLETVRAVARKWLASDPQEQSLAFGAHHRWALRVARQANEPFDVSGRGLGGDARHPLDGYHDDLRLAIQRCPPEQTEELLELALALARYDLDRAHYSVARTTLRSALEGAPAAPAATRGQALRALSVLEWRIGDHREATRASEQGLALARAIGDADLEARLLNNLGAISSSQGDYASARRFLEQALAMAAQSGNGEVEASAQSHLGTVARLQGEWSEAADRLNGALRWARRVGDEVFVAACLPRLGGLAWAVGDYKRAGRLDQEGLGLARKLGRTRVELHCLMNLGYVAWSEGRLAESRAWFTEALELGEASDHRVSPSIHLGLARIERAEGRLAIGAALVARVLADAGRRDRMAALEAIEEAALIARGAGDLSAAAELADGAEFIRSTSGKALEAPHVEELEALRAELAPSRFRGETAGLDEVVAIAAAVVRQISGPA